MGQKPTVYLPAVPQPEPHLPSCLRFSGATSPVAEALSLAPAYHRGFGRSTGVRAALQFHQPQSPVLLSFVLEPGDSTDRGWNVGVDGS